MSFYQAMITLAVKRFLIEHHKTANWLAKQMGVSTSTINAKMAISNPRGWSLEDLLALGALGVNIPRIPVNRIEKGATNE
ncbi:hypothetical protein K5713_04230 [Trueperella pyogenes]|uniref:hypothetical protein n=1 Tax=Trueperella pyogenes TaxID=1661 RepID=UPI002167986C|nr:hypothetical protein [Trueperella pyogenes]UVJ54496.1 hypothetical protein K5713_04230 [Trueperella pyogenes]